ncbi:hypothetical protein BKA70DRAFT_1116924 [Coprinopsis sp. MPI-PUGE-AT-0042]|nr:hypothetical protein BKA70DRAFT_1116924 [Coprinopsis sp. MPI-PUGE-AT-0042]
MHPSLSFAPPPLRNLTLTDWQSLLDFMSSRIRAASQSYVFRFGDLSEDSRISFLNGISREMYTATFMMSFALMLHPHAIVHPPCLRDMFVVTFNGGSDPASLDGASMGGFSQRDAILDRYIDAWWEEPNQPREVEIAEIVALWNQHKAFAIQPLPQLPPASIRLADLSMEKLHEAQKLTRQALGIVEKGLITNFTSLKRVKSSLRQFELQEGTQPREEENANSQSS